jgi:hypothetical protein
MLRGARFSGAWGGFGFQEILERTRCCAKLLLARTRTLLNERKKQLRKQHV